MISTCLPSRRGRGGGGRHPYVLEPRNYTKRQPCAGAAGAGQPEHGREERGGGDHTRAALRQASQSGQKTGITMEELRGGCL
jgi:hypothetical protein